jgi:glycosyltransferase involved in cell wall biosynthesis
MHVLITADTVGGVWTYVRELTTALARRGVRITLVSLGHIPSPHQTEWMEDLPQFDFRPTAFRLEWMQDSEQDLELSTQYLLAVIREVQPDLVHLNQYGYGAMDIDVPKVLVAHSDVVSWWFAVHGGPPPETPWLRWYRDTVLRGLLGADVVVAPSQTMLDAIRAHYFDAWTSGVPSVPWACGPTNSTKNEDGVILTLSGAKRKDLLFSGALNSIRDAGHVARGSVSPPESAKAGRNDPQAPRTQVICNGRTPTLFNPHVSKEGYAISVGRLWDGGKQAVLLTQIEPPLPVYLVGSDAHPDDACRGGALRAHNDKLRFCGQKSERELRQLYSRADMYLAPSRYEPFGLAPLEAALSRCALVLNDIPSFRELWGEHACYFRRNDAASLASAMEQFTLQPASCRAYANLAYRHARTRFSGERMAGEYLELYHSLVRAEVSAA